MRHSVREKDKMRESEVPRGKLCTFKTVSAACKKNEIIIKILQIIPASIREPVPDPLKMRMEII